MFQYAIYRLRTFKAPNDVIGMASSLLSSWFNNNKNLYPLLETPVLEGLAKDIYSAQRLSIEILSEWLAEQLILQRSAYLTEFWKSSASELKVLEKQISEIEPFSEEEIDAQTNIEDTEEYTDIEAPYRKKMLAAKILLPHIDQFKQESLIQIKEVQIEKAYVVVSIPFGYNDEWNYSYPKFAEKIKITTDYNEAQKLKKELTVGAFEWFFDLYIYALMNENPKNKLKEIAKNIEKNNFDPRNKSYNGLLEQIHYHTYDIEEKYLQMQEEYENFTMDAFKYCVLRSQKKDVTQAAESLYQWLKDYFYTIHNY